MTDDLSKMGEFRANNLDQVFGTGNTPAGYHTPDIIYAMMSKPVSSVNSFITGSFTGKCMSSRFSGQNGHLYLPEMRTSCKRLLC